MGGLLFATIIIMAYFLIFYLLGRFSGISVVKPNILFQEPEDNAQEFEKLLDLLVKITRPLSMARYDRWRDAYIVQGGDPSCAYRSFLAEKARGKIRFATARDYTKWLTGYVRHKVDASSFSAGDFLDRPMAAAYNPWLIITADSPDFTIIPLFGVSSIHIIFAKGVKINRSEQYPYHHLYGHSDLYAMDKYWTSACGVPVFSDVVLPEPDLNDKLRNAIWWTKQRRLAELRRTGCPYISSS